MKLSDLGKVTALADKVRKLEGLRAAIKSAKLTEPLILTDARGTPSAPNGTKFNVNELLGDERLRKLIVDGVGTVIGEVHAELVTLGVEVEATPKE